VLDAAASDAAGEEPLEVAVRRALLAALEERRTRRPPPVTRSR
jgi:hypothetical protein